LRTGFLLFFHPRRRDYGDRGKATHVYHEYVPPEATRSNESQPQGSNPKECRCLKAKPIFRQVQRSLPIQNSTKNTYVYMLAVSLLITADETK